MTPADIHPHTDLGGPEDGAECHESVDGDATGADSEGVRGALSQTRLIVAQFDGQWVLEHRDERFGITEPLAIQLADRLPVEVVALLAPPTGSVGTVVLTETGAEIAMFAASGAVHAIIDDDPVATAAPIHARPAPLADGWLPTTFTVSFDGCTSAALHFYLPEIDTAGPKAFRMIYNGAVIGHGVIIRGDETIVEISIADLGRSPQHLTVEIDEAEPHPSGDERSLGVILAAVTRTPISMADRSWT